MRAPFIVFEGIDGAGTTTQAERLVARYAAEGTSAMLTHEPSTGPIGVLIRQMLSKRVVLPPEAGAPAEPVGRQTLAALFAADRLDHIEAEVAPALAAGRPVICDRYVPSSLAYQGDVEHDEQGRESVDYDWILALNERAKIPDLTFFLEVDIETSLARIGARGRRRDIYETREKLERLVRRYEEVLALLEDRGDPIVRLDARQNIEALHASVWARVQAL